jgi:hypothetical protein
VPVINVRWRAPVGAVHFHDTQRGRTGLVGTIFYEFGVHRVHLRPITASDRG